MYASLIALLCSAFPLTANLPQTPCQKALDATFMRTGFSAQLKKTEAYANRSTLEMGKRYLSQEVLAVGGAAYLVAVKKSVSFSTRQIPLVHTTTFEGSPEGGAIKMGWSF